MAVCIVSFLDTNGIRHSVEIEAASLFEAAVLAVKIFRDHDCAPGEISRLEVEIRSSVTHEVTLKKVRQWLDGGAKTPKNAVMKDRLKLIIMPSDRYSHSSFPAWYTTHKSHVSNLRKDHPSFGRTSMSFGKTNLNFAQAIREKKRYLRQPTLARQLPELLPSPLPKL